MEKAVVRLRSALRRPWTDGALDTAPETGAEELGSDTTRIDEKVEGIRRDAIGNRSREARDLYRAYRAVATRLRQQRWVRRAARVGRRQAATTTPYQAIISCGPSHAEHPAARRIAAATKVPYVMDMRDPWSLVERVDESLASPLWFRFVERAERRCVHEAALVVANTDLHRDALRERYRREAERIVTVRNGYDEVDVPGGEGEEDGVFRVLYMGAVYGTRDPGPFLQGAARAVDELEADPERFAIEFLGPEGRSSERVVALARSVGLQSFEEWSGRVPHHEALRRSARASLLLNLPQDTLLCIPSKVYKYMPFRAWTLALERKGSATEHVLRETRADVLEPDDIRGIERVLTHRFRQWAAGERPERISTDPRYSRKYQARRMLNALEEIGSIDAIGQ